MCERGGGGAWAVLCHGAATLLGTCVTCVTCASCATMTWRGEVIGKAFFLALFVAYTREKQNMRL